MEEGSKPKEKNMNPNPQKNKIKFKTSFKTSNIKGQYDRTIDYVLKKCHKPPL